jgi:hypothetical protein
LHTPASATAAAFAVNIIAPRSILPTSTLLFLLVNSSTYWTHLHQQHQQNLYQIAAHTLSPYAQATLPTSTLLFLLVNSFTYCTHLHQQHQQQLDMVSQHLVHLILTLIRMPHTPPPYG